jgi:glycosyltransferase involved in cell wall biosynthesis
LPPAIRIRFIATQLSEFGWEPIVLSTDPKYYDWPVDPESEQLLPDSLKVIRTPAVPAKLARRFGFGDIGLRSLWYHWRTLSRLCNGNQIDLIFIPVPPYFPMVLGRLAHLRFGVPYVIDYIDPWVTDYYWKVPRSQRPPKWVLSDFLSRKLERFSIRRVAHIIGVSKGTTDGVVARYPWLSEDNATEIPYGGEEAATEYVRAHPRPNQFFDPDDGLLHVSYVGRGGPDMLPALRQVFAAVLSGLKRSPQLFGRLRLHFIGTTYANSADQYYFLPLARELGLEAIVDEHPGRVPYFDALQILSDSHALIVVGSEEAHYTASKIFPYILSRRAILAVFHEKSSVVKILRETEAGAVVTFDQQDPVSEKAEEISMKLEKILALPSDYVVRTCWKAFEPYTTRAMTARLARTFDQAVAQH